MTTANTATCDTTMVLEWARDFADVDEVTASFWNRLCEAVGLPPRANANEVLTELGRYGGNTLVNVFRGAGVPYDEVAYDVAETLRSWGEASGFTQGRPAACEAFVLWKMEVAEEDLDLLARAVKTKSNARVKRAAARIAADKAAARAVGGYAARVVAQAAGRAAAKKVLAKAGEKVATRATRQAAAQVAHAVTKQVLARVLAATNVVLIAWTIVDLAGPALRVTIPAVTYIALLRRLYENVASGLRSEAP